MERSAGHSRDAKLGLLVTQRDTGTGMRFRELSTCRADPQLCCGMTAGWLPVMASSVCDWAVGSVVFWVCRMRLVD